MKIIFVRSYNMFAETGASANRWRSLVEGLAKLNVDIVLFFISGYLSEEEKKKYGKGGVINSKISYKYASGENRYSYWSARINIYVMSWFHSFINRYHFEQLIHEINPEIVLIAPGVDVFRLISRILTKNNRTFKLALEINEIPDSNSGHVTNLIQKFLFKHTYLLLTHRIFPKLDICIVMTDPIKDYFSELPDLNPAMSFFKVPMTVDLGRFSVTNPLNDLQKPYIAYCGSSSFKKDGVDILIRSFAQISNDYPDLKLNIVAFWEIDGSKMMNLIHETKLGKRISYLGTLKREEIPTFLINASVLALPRPDSLQATGGFPTKLGEYLASGNPVCVTRVGEIPDYLVDNESAFIAEPGNIDSFANSLRRALSDKENSARVGRNGRKVAEIYFNMDVQAKRLYDFFLEKI